MASEVLSMCTESLPILRSVCIFEARSIYLRKQDASPQIVDPAAVPLVFMLLYVQRLIDYWYEGPQNEALLRFWSLWMLRTLGICFLAPTSGYKRGRTTGLLSAALTGLFVPVFTYIHVGAPEHVVDKYSRRNIMLCVLLGIAEVTGSLFWWLLYYSTLTSIPYGCLHRLWYCLAARREYIVFFHRLCYEVDLCNQHHWSDGGAENFAGSALCYCVSSRLLLAV
ncbi:hypothetical protein KL950_000737 [Ogataea haglerorum]|nr:hypothetical protein KL950_000737 [Ogataea haglerorum]